MVPCSPSFGKWCKRYALAAWASTLLLAFLLQKLLTVPKFYCAPCFSATTDSAGQTITVNVFLGEMERLAEAIAHKDFKLCVKS